MKKMALALALAVLGFGPWAAPALALYAPCQGVNAWLVGTTVHYTVTDPISGQAREETWALNIGDLAAVESLQVDGGIVAWIAKYKWVSEAAYSYAVHYRIFDPGRGVWKGGSWGWFSSGGARAVNSLIVKDGVVAWKSKHQLSTNPTDIIEHAVRYATYNPGNGSWPLGEDTYQVAYGSRVGPENLRLKNGLVAWPMDPVDAQDSVDIFSRIYDPELNQWVGGYLKLNLFGEDGFNWIEIVDNTAQVQVRNTGAGYSWDSWLSYDPNKHSWHIQSSYGSPPRPQPIRRASFTAQPASGFAPLSVCLWDTSIALTGGAWSWDHGDGTSGTGRSPLEPFIKIGVCSVQNAVVLGGQTYPATTKVVDVKPFTPPTGGLQINGGAAYTNSLNVTLSLNYNQTATQMRFSEWPGRWIDWGNVAPSRAYQVFWNPAVLKDGLRTVYVQFRDAEGNESEWYQDEITVDMTLPAPMLILNYGHDTTRDPNIRAEWNAIDANGVAKMRYNAFNEGDVFMPWTLWMDYQDTVMTIPFSARPGKKTVMVEFMDVAGNVTQVQDSARLIRKSIPYLLLLLGD